VKKQFTWFVAEKRHYVSC